MGSAKKQRASGASVSEELSLWDRLQATNDYPLSVLLSLTDRCPLSCAHCYITEREESGELTTEEVFSLIGELARLGTIRLTLTGGETGIRPDLRQVVEEAKQLRFAVTLKTSSVLFDETDIDDLRHAGLSELEVSIYHPDPEEHDRFVGMDGAWRRAVDALDRFRSLGGAVRADTVLMSWNADGISRFVDLCEAHSWKYGVDVRLTPPHGTNQRNVSLPAGEDIIASVLKDLRLTKPSGFEKVAQSSICNAGTNSAYITPKGDVLACPDLLLPWGNIREQSFAEIWDNSPVRQRLREVLRWGNSPKCLECRHLFYCTRCPGDAYLEHGNIEAPASFDCILAEAVGRTRR